MNPNEPIPDRPSPQEGEKTRLTGGPEWTDLPQPDAPPSTRHEPPGSTANSPFGPGREPPNAADLPQSLQGRYRLIRVLGSGGFANVYLAHDGVLDQPVAIKVLRLGLAAPSDRDRFLMEARIGAKLRHPNIVTVFDILQTAEGLQMVMEYYPGGTLTERIRAKGPLPAREAVDITRQVAQALGYAHRHSVIHRDVKPANIFLSGDGTVKLGDFGIASHSDRHEFTQTGMIIGTPLYMPPEQSSDSRDVDPRTDIYALGLTLYHMLTGRPPRVVDLDSIPETFRRLIKLATAPERSERLVSCEQVIAMLDHVPLKASPTRRAATPNASDAETEIDTPATPTSSTSTRTVTGQSTGAAAPEAPTAPPPPSPQAPAQAPRAPAAAPIPVVAAPTRPRRSLWPLWMGVALLGVAAVAVVAFMVGDLMSEPGPVKSAAAMSGRGERPPGNPIDTPLPGREPGFRNPPRPIRDRMMPGERLPGASTQTMAQRVPPAIQAMRDRREALLAAMTPTPTPAPTPYATPPVTPRPTPAIVPGRTLDMAFNRYLQTNPGIASSVEILHERGGAGKPEGMRAFEVRQAQSTLMDAIQKTPNDPILNLIVGNMLQRNGREKDAAIYFERAVMLDRRTGSPLGLNLEVIREYLNRPGASGQKTRRKMAM